MLPEDIDDLFRNKLDGHPTPPGDALWARLQAGPAAEPSTDTTPDNSERLDQLFQKGLNTHATPPARELWERLEDEHLRPRKRRPAAWWPMALAAAVALFIIAGGAGLWLGFPGGNTQSGTVASHQTKGNKSTSSSQVADLETASNKGTVATKVTTTKGSTATQETEAAAANDAANTAAAATNNAAQSLKMASSTANQKNVATQATRLPALASTASKARMAAARQSPRHPLGTSRQPDAATNSSPLVARTTPRPARRPALNHIPPTAADELRPTTKPEILVAATLKPALAPEIVPAHAVPALANTSELITVDVRNGAAPAGRPARTSITALAEADAPEERRGLGGRLLRQAGHLVRGERVSLADATGLPENVTLRATVAGRSLTKSIQL